MFIVAVGVRHASLIVTTVSIEGWPQRVRPQNSLYEAIPVCIRPAVNATFVDGRHPRFAKRSARLISHH
jgi:hypothetical protein